MEMLRMLHDDLLLSEEKSFNGSNSPIWTPPLRKDDPNYRQRIIFYRVLAVGSEAKEIKEGYLVAIPWTDTTLPFTVNNKRYCLTSEKKVWFRVEEDG